MFWLEGYVYVDGELGSRSFDLSGGGVGGSIVICLFKFDGEGIVLVNGGLCLFMYVFYGGGGVGGCIVVYYNGSYIFIGLF